MERRTILKSVAASCVLGLGGVGAYQFYLQSKNTAPIDSKYAYQFLTEDDRVLLDVLIPVLLSDSQESKRSNTEHICQNIDAAIIRLSVQTQVELRELFTLLGSVFGRLLVAQVWLNWSAAGAKSVDSFLLSWRESSLELLQIAYKGLHKLVIGSFYSERASWQSIGYSGPPKIQAIGE